MATVNGTSGDDRGVNELVGTSAADEIFGFEGRDDLTGLAGNDTLDGGAGLRDSARYYDAPAGIHGSLTSNIVSDGYGDTDTLIDIEEIRGSSNNDTLIGATGGEIFLRGRGGDDVLIGNNTSTSGGTNLDGGDGNDTLTNVGGLYSFLQPGKGTDSITGSAISFDIVSYFFSAGYDDPPATQGITVTFSGEGVGSVTDYVGDIDSFTSVERFEGTMFADVMTGAGGFQSFVGTGGNDTIDGGDGFDEVNFDGTRDDFATETGVIVDLSMNTATDKFGDTDTLMNIESVRGSRFADQITGDAGDNSVRGQDGNDTINGGLGADTLMGGDGNDSLLGGGVPIDANDRLYGENGDDFLQITGHGFAYGGAGEDTIVGLPGPIDEFVTASYIDDPSSVVVNLTITAQGGVAGGNNATGFLVRDGHGDTDVLLGVHQVEGSTGNDQFFIDGNYQNSFGSWVSIRPEAGNDTIVFTSVSNARVDYREIGSAVVADLEAGTATDLVNGTNIVGMDVFTGATRFRGSAEGDLINGKDGDDQRIRGHDGDDTINGLGGNDLIRGENGNDTLTGGSGADTIDGGADFDIANYLDSGAAVNINLVTGVSSGGEATGDTFIDIEAFWASNLNDTLVGGSDFNDFSGWGGNDHLIGGDGGNNIAGDDGDDTIEGGAGVDTLDGYADWDVLSFLNEAGGVGVSVTFNNGRVVDTFGSIDSIANIEEVWGSAQSDLMSGNSSANRFEGNNGNDRLLGQGGDDTLIGGEGDDVLSGGGDADSIEGGDGEDLLLGGGGNDIAMLGGADNDILSAGGGNDTGVDGGSGEDTVLGAAGNDELNGGDDDDTLSGGSGDDTVQGDGGADLVLGADNDDTVEGGAGTDTVSGGSGNDSVVGDDGDDRLLGASGNDTLIGGEGNDNLSGGLDADTYVFNSGEGEDTIVGYEQGLETLVLNSNLWSGSGTLTEQEVVTNFANQLSPGVIEFAFDGGEEIRIVNGNGLDINTFAADIMFIV